MRLFSLDCSEVVDDCKDWLSDETHVAPKEEVSDVGVLNPQGLLHPILKDDERVHQAEGQHDPVAKFSDHEAADPFVKKGRDEKDDHVRDVPADAGGDERVDHVPLEKLVDRHVPQPPVLAQVPAVPPVLVELAVAESQQLRDDVQVVVEN